MKLKIDYKSLFDARVLPKIQITNSECWETSIADNGSGYKYIHARPIRISIHRLAYLAFIGEIPKGMSILHRCDNRGCCNPRHLRVGTQADNMKNMNEKGRRGVWHPFGNKNPSKQLIVRKKLSEFAIQRNRSKKGTFIKETE